MGAYKDHEGHRRGYEGGCGTVQVGKRAYNKVDYDLAKEYITKAVVSAVRGYEALEKSKEKELEENERTTTMKS